MKLPRVGGLGWSGAIFAAALAAAPACHPETSAGGLNGLAGGVYADCRGQRSGAPTVVLEAGAFGAAVDWDLVLDDLATGGRVCAYDRGGIGRSPPRAGDGDVVSIAHELRGLLDSLGESGPVILVGHSNGALYVETFAALWPERVAGLVYVNGVTSDDRDDPVLMGYLHQERLIADAAVTAAELGLAPLIAGPVARSQALGPAATARKREALTALPGLRTARNEDRRIVEGLDIPRSLGGPPRSIPVAVVVGQTHPDAASSRAWRAAEIAGALRARRAWILDAPGASHVSPLARDRAYVAAAVNWLRSLPGPDVGH